MDTLNVKMLEEKLPECWSDDKRMNALFAPCKHASLAPEAWSQKVLFWSEQLRSWCRQRRSPAVTVNAARDAFMRNGNRPACVHVVLDHLVRTGEYVPASKYLNILQGTQEGWVRWGAKLAFKPAAIAVGVVTSLLPFDRVPKDGMAVATIDREEIFVNNLVLKELATDFLLRLPPDLERLGALEDFVSAGKELGYSADNVRIMMGYMLSEGMAVRSGDVFKLAEAGQTRAKPVTESDRAAHKLLAAERRLKTDLETLRREEKRATEEARRAVKLGERAQAKSHLIRKRQLTARAEVCEGALDNVTRLLCELKQAELNSGIVDTYRHSLDAMKTVINKDGLTEDNVHDTMDEIKDVLEQCSEVERALAGGADSVERAELEEELAELLASPSRPGDGGGASVDKEVIEESPERPLELPSPPRAAPSDDVMFDGEARMMRELDSLSISESPKRVVAASDAAGAPGPSWTPQKQRPDWPPQKQQANWTPQKQQSDWTTQKQQPDWATSRPCQAWYPPIDQALPSDNLNRSLEALKNSSYEVSTDQRLHPGQKLHRSTDHFMYSDQFQVQDHKLDDGVWLFNSQDAESLAHDSRKTKRTFAVAPGTGRGAC